MWIFIVLLTLAVLSLIDFIVKVERDLDAHDRMYQQFLRNMIESLERDIIAKSKQR